MVEALESFWPQKTFADSLYISMALKCDQI